MSVQINAEKYVCEICKTTSYDSDDFEICNECDSVVCVACVTYTFKNSINVPICEKCLKIDE